MLQQVSSWVVYSCFVRQAAKSKLQKGGHFQLAPNLLCDVEQVSLPFGVLLSRLFHTQQHSESHSRSGRVPLGRCVEHHEGYR